MTHSIGFYAIVQTMLFKKITYSVIFKAVAMGMVCLFTFNSISWSLPGSTLAAQSRLKPFFKRHGLGFQNIATVVYVSGRLKDLLAAEIIRESHIVKLNRLFPDDRVEIEKEVKTGHLKCTGKQYQYAVFHFKKESKVINMLFIKDHDKLTNAELQELGIKTDRDRTHFLSPGLEGVWLINSAVGKTTDTDITVPHTTVFAEQITLNVILESIPPGTPIEEARNIIYRHPDFDNDKFEAFLKKFPKLLTLVRYFSNLIPVLIETRQSLVELERKANEILETPELRELCEREDSYPAYAHRARALLVSDEVCSLLKDILAEKDGRKLLEDYRISDNIYAYLSSRMAREATCAFLTQMKLSILSDAEFRRPSILTYGDDLVRNMFWYYLPIIYKQLRRFGYSFEQAGKRLFYLSENFLEEDLRIPIRFYWNTDWTEEIMRNIEGITRYGSVHEKQINEFLRRLCRSDVAEDLGESTVFAVRPKEVKGDNGEVLRNSNGETFDGVWARFQPSDFFSGDAVQDPKEWSVDSESERKLMGEFERMNFWELQAEFINKESDMRRGGYNLEKIYPQTPPLIAYINWMSSKAIHMGAELRGPLCGIDIYKKHGTKEEVKEAYREKCFLREVIRRWRKTAETGPNPEIFLDIGSGKGGVVVDLAKNNPKAIVYAIDPDYKDPSAKGRKYIREHAPNINIVDEAFKEWKAEALIGKVSKAFWIFPNLKKGVSPFSASKIAGLLKPGGVFTMVLDDARVEGLTGFKKQLQEEGLKVEYTSNIAFRDLCKYEKMVSSSTMAQAFMLFEKKYYPTPVSAVLRATKSNELPQVEAERIHAENLKIEYMPAIPDKTILCHIVADSILPDGQKDMLKRLEQEMRKRDDYSEKVVSLSVSNPNNQEEFMRELERIKAQEEKRYQDKGYTVQFDVACPSIDLVASIQDKLGIQALAFAKEGEGDIVQVEGIILALRVIRTGNVDDLLKVYKLLTGKEFKTDINDIKELAKNILFILPVTRLDINEIGTINTLIEENIKNAA